MLITHSEVEKNNKKKKEKNKSQQVREEPFCLSGGH